MKETDRFVVVDRENMEETAREAQIKGQAQTLNGADFAISGDVVEYGQDIETAPVVFAYLRLASIDVSLFSTTRSAWRRSAG